jgi:hypothetical protein
MPRQATLHAVETRNMEREAILMNQIHADADKLREVSERAHADGILHDTAASKAYDALNRRAE